MPLSEEQPIIVEDAREAEALQRLQRLVANQDMTLELVLPDGAHLRLPASVQHALARIVPLLARGEGVLLRTLPRESTAYEAAVFLNMDEATVFQRMHEGSLPFHEREAERYVLLSDILAYKRRRSKERRDALDALLALAQDTGTYE